MRTKSCGSKARVSKIPQTEPSMAPPPPPPLNGKFDLFTKVENTKDNDRDRDNNNNVCAHSREHRHSERFQMSLNDDHEEANIVDGTPNKMDKGAAHDGKASIAPQVPPDNCDGLYLACLAKLEWTALGLCVVCKKGKEVLSCGSSDCVFVVHASCLGFQPSFDDTGRFYCPPCLYKRSIFEVGEVEKEVVLAEERVHSVKNFLSSFLSSSTPEETTGRRGREELIPSGIVGDGCGTSSNQDNVEQLQRSKSSTGVSEDQQETVDINVNGKDSSMVEKSLATKRNDSILTGKVDHVKQVSGAQHKSMVDQLEQVDNLQKKGTTNVKSTGVMEDQQKSVESTECSKDSSGKEQSPASKRSDSKVTGAKRVCRGQHKIMEDQQDAVSEDQCTSESLSDDISLQNETKDTAATAGKRNKSSKKTSKIALRGSRRQKLYWTDEEEKMLKEGVRKFKPVLKKNIPWRDVLAHGSGVFNDTRTPDDLKYKWKLLKKVAHGQGSKDPIFNS